MISNTLYLFFSQFINLILNQLYSRQNTSIDINNAIYLVTNLFTNYIYSYLLINKYFPSNLLYFSKFINVRN